MFQIRTSAVKSALDKGKEINFMAVQDKLGAWHLRVASNDGFAELETERGTIRRFKSLDTLKAWFDGELHYDGSFTVFLQSEDTSQ